MKKSLLFVCILYFIFLEIVVASHAGGGEITYRCIGNGQYEVSCILYRDCRGITAPTVLVLEISNNCGLPYGSSQSLYPLLPPEIIASSCPEDTTACDYPGGNLPGIQKYVYMGTIVLPAPCEEWILSFRISAHALTTTFINSSAEDFYLQATLNNSVNSVPCNSSPVFKNLPVLVACIDQPVCIDPGIYDADGDSIVCLMSAPLIYLNTPLVYSQGYSISEPLTTAQPIEFNSRTGEMCFTPMQQEVTILNILVKEYRNGILISQITREMLLFVRTCPDNTPSLTGFLGTTVYTLTICAGMQTCYPIYSMDVDTGDTTVIAWDYGIPSASYYNSGGQNDAGLFCWNPDTSYIRSDPYCFQATVTDNNCHGFKSRKYQYCIFVIDSNSACFPLSSPTDQKENFSLKIFPQPASQHFSIDIGFNPAHKEKYWLSICDVLGKNIIQTSIRDQVTIINTGDWIRGIYIVNLFSDSKGLVSRNKLTIIE